MANVPCPSDPKIRESTIKVFRQKYFPVNSYGERDSAVRESRVEVMVDDDGVFIESRDGGAAEALSIATPQMAMRVAKHILEEYGESASGAEGAMELDESDAFGAATIKFLTSEVQELIAHEMWRLRNHIISPHGPVEASGAAELLTHLERITDLIDIKPKPKSLSTVKVQWQD